MASSLVGVLGGLGPAAGFHFCSRLTELNPVRREQDHLRVVVWSDPRVPDRSNALLHGGESVVPSLRRGVSFLKESGADFLVVPCNTVHLWIPGLAQDVGIELLSIVEANVSELASRMPRGGPVAVLGTDATVDSRMYQDALRERGLEPVENTRPQQRALMQAIYDVKLGIDKNRIHAAELLQDVIVDVEEKGALTIVLGCTELNLLAKYCTFRVPVVDSLDTLAKSTIVRANSNR